MQASSQPTLYEQLGGKEAISAVVEEFYRRVLADESLKDLFKDTDMDKLKRHQTAFLTFAVGGPNEYRGRTIRKAHEGLNITEEQFMSVAKHLSDSLKQFNVPQDAIDQVIQIVAALKDDVVGQ